MVVRWKALLVNFITAAAVLWGCVNQDNRNEGCETDRVQGLEVSFYSRSRCQQEAVYPEEINDIQLFVFDGEGLLVQHTHIEDVGLQGGYSVKVETDPGLYTVIGWAGADPDHFETTEPLDGTTRREDLLLRIKRTENMADDISGVVIYMGESRAVYVSQAGGEEPEYTPVSVNLLEQTNRIEISVEGLPTDARDYGIFIEADNGSMDYDGEIAPDETLVYQPELGYGEGAVNGSFTLLKLETGHNYFISVRNTVSGTELYHGSLLGALILKNPEVDLRCDHDFTIRFTAEDQCDCGTYAITEIWVNNWLVHSYETEL